MWFEIMKFEFRYRKKRPAVYLYFLTAVLVGFTLVTTDAIKYFGTGGQIKENASLVIFKLEAILSYILGIFITSAIMGVAVIRDFEHRTEAIFFTTPISKFDYLFGRFAGSFIILILILTGIPLGLMIGEFMPWRESDRLQAFSIFRYWSPYFKIVIPNGFILASVFFASGALSRKMLVIFVQGIAFFLLYQISNTLFGQLDNKELAALLDPLGIKAMSYETRYWSIVQQNTGNVTYSGYFLKNRLLWTAVSVGILILTYYTFKLSQVLNPIVKKKTGTAGKHKEYADNGIPEVHPVFNRISGLKSLQTMTFFYFRIIIKDLPFRALCICGLAWFVYSATSVKGWYGTSIIPGTSVMINASAILTGFFSYIIMVIYCGDLIWKERDVRINLIKDATPSSSEISLLGKYFALVLAFCSLYVSVIFTGVFLQAVQGNYQFEWILYIKSLGFGLLSLMLWMLLGFFVHTIVNNKFAGHGIMIAFFIILTLFELIGIHHKLLTFDSASLTEYSEMNGFGHSVISFSWLNLYWLSFALILFGLAALLAVRGSEELLSRRIKVGNDQLSRPFIVFFLAALILFVSSGFYIYYNTNVLNKYESGEQQNESQANFEKKLKGFEKLNQPKITNVKLNVELYPKSRQFSAEGFFILRNKSKKPIDQIHIQCFPSDDMAPEYMKLSQASKLDSRFVKDFHYYIYHLARPLLPDDSLKFSFSLKYDTKGFRNDKGDMRVVYNGTFLDQNYLPTLGYNEEYELSTDDDRKKYGLKPKERMMVRENPIGKSRSYTTDDADLINFEMTIGTEADQTALAPGYLQKTLEKDGRKYFTYKMDTPIKYFYSIVSGKYEVKKEVYKGISLEIYHHPDHTYNIERMMNAMKDALDYYQQAFGPYQHRQLRIMEFPRYLGFAQSFANTIPFGENMGFVMKIDDQKDIDMPYFVTAHEIAHQWWGHQVTGADVRGAAMLSESLAEYSALMLMGKHYPKEKMQEFLKYELDDYLNGRANEHKKEMPLDLVEGQSYIHYNKGSHVLYALQDYIGEKKLNSALMNFLQKWNNLKVDKSGIYPTTADLTRELRAVTPDTLQYLITDFIENITLYENKVDEANVIQRKGGFEVDLKATFSKIRADSVGNEKPLNASEWVWVGLYGKPAKDGKDQLIYYRRHRVNTGSNSLKIFVKEEPLKAGIDPLNILIDRHTIDNLKLTEKMQ